ncbi:MAG: cell wall hydrolase [Bacillota bacterium]|nr:cell wall hydrolase [Bacillota bacterium]
MRKRNYLIMATVTVIILVASYSVFVNSTNIADEVNELVISAVEENKELTIEEALDKDVANELAEEQEQNSEQEQSVLASSITDKENDRAFLNEAPKQKEDQSNNNNETKESSSTEIAAVAEAVKGVTHQVKTGESLFLISRQYGITVEELRGANKLSSDEVIVNQILNIPNSGDAPPVMQTASRGTTSNRFSEDDIYWLARIIHAEARGESYEGQVAVGAVVLNRVKSANFPNSVYGVIFEKWDGKYYQFSPVLDGSINLEPNQSALRAARDAINGVDPTGGALYFYNPATSTNKWIFNLPVHKKIGKHSFAL